MNFKELAKENWKSIVAILLIFSIACLNTYLNRPKEDQARDVDTIIPKGFVLIPIEIENYKSLDQILGKYGKVDLYERISEGPKNRVRLVARAVGALRAPFDESQVGVLVPEKDAREVLKARGAFVVTIHNQEVSGMRIENRSSPRKRKIIIEGNQ